jgi:hypothetical protein
MVRAFPVVISAMALIAAVAVLVVGHNYYTDRNVDYQYCSFYKVPLDRCPEGFRGR